MEWFTLKDIKTMREELKITAQDMAIVIGVSRMTLWKWEKDINAMPLGKYRQAVDYLNEKGLLRQQ